MAKKKAAKKQAPKKGAKKAAPKKAGKKGAKKSAVSRRAGKATEARTDRERGTQFKLRQTLMSPTRPGKRGSKRETPLGLGPDPLVHSNVERTVEPVSGKAGADAAVAVPHSVVQT